MPKTERMGNNFSLSGRKGEQNAYAHALPTRPSEVNDRRLPQMSGRGPLKSLDTRLRD